MRGRPRFCVAVDVRREKRRALLDLRTSPGALPRPDPLGRRGESGVAGSSPAQPDPPEKVLRSCNAAVGLSVALPKGSAGGTCGGDASYRAREAGYPPADTGFGGRVAAHR